VNPIVPYENLIYTITGHIEGNSLEYAKQYMLEVVCDLLMQDSKFKSQMRTALAGQITAASLEKAIDIFSQDRYSNPYAHVISKREDSPSVLELHDLNQRLSRIAMPSNEHAAQT